MVDSKSDEWKIQDELGTSGGLLKEDRNQHVGAPAGSSWNNLSSKKIMLVLDFKPETKIYAQI